MSKTTKRKHVTREVLDEYTLPEKHQQIVKVTASRGNNLHEVRTAAGELFLVSMPTKFRKNVWIKRGDFVIIDPIPEGDKVKAEITTILYPKQVKYIQREGLWPDEFLSKPTVTDQKNGNRDGNHDTALIAKDLSGINLTDVRQPGADDSNSDTDSDGDLFVNTNRPTVTYYYTDSDDEEGEGEEEEEDDQEDEER